MRFGQLALFALSISSPIRAYANLWDGSDTLVVRSVNERAAPGSSPTDSSASPTSPPSSSSKTSSPKDSSTNTDDTASPSPTPTGTGTASNESGDLNLNTAKPGGTKTKGGKGGSKGNSTATDDDDASPSHTTFNVLDPAGGVAIHTPVTNVPIGTALFKIGDILTFGWNYTSLQASPTAIDVLITCSTSSSLWTLTQNMTFQTSVKYIWDTQQQAEDINQPLLTAVYTLIIKDSDVSMDARPEPGYFTSFAGFRFGLYKKQPYVPFPDFKCLDCNGGPGGFDFGVVRLAVTMGLISILSFTWFVGGIF